MFFFPHVTGPKHWWWDCPRCSDDSFRPWWCFLCYFPTLKSRLDAYAWAISSKAFHCSCKSRSELFKLKPNSHGYFKDIKQIYTNSMKLPPFVNGSCIFQEGFFLLHLRQDSALVPWDLALTALVLRCGDFAADFALFGRHVSTCPGTMVCPQGHIQWACLNLNDYAMAFYGLVEERSNESNELGQIRTWNFNKSKILQRAISGSAVSLRLTFTGSAALLESGGSTSICSHLRAVLPLAVSELSQWIVLLSWKTSRCTTCKESFNETIGPCLSFCDFL